MISSVKELRRLAQNKPDILLFNPLVKDFSTKFAGFDKVTLRGGEITAVNGYIADRVKKQLVDFIMNERETDPIAAAAQRVLEEVEVKI